MSKLSEYGSMREVRQKPVKQVPTQIGGKQIVSSTVEKYTTLEQLEKEDRGPVYVINNLKGAYKGMVIIPIARRNGNGQDVLRIPPTFIPVDLTLQVAKAQLLESTEFRRTVGKKLVLLMNPEYARRLLATPEGQKEAQQVSANMAQAKLMVESQVMGGNDESDMVNSTDDADEESASMHQAAQMMNSEDNGEDEEAQVKVNSTKRKAQAAKTLKNVDADDEDKKPQPRVKFKRVVQNCLDENKAQTEIVADLKSQRPLTLVEVKHANKYFKTMPRVARFLEAEKLRIREKEKAA